MDAVEQARDELYGLDPEAFMDRRGELAAAARAAGDALAAKQIAALRKPTRAAHAVNLLVRAVPDAAARLAELGGELREAQQRLDGAALRELSQRRNKLVDQLARIALRELGAPAAAALRDEVAATLSAAIADPDVLDRVRAGALVRPERWDGLGGVGVGGVGAGGVGGRAGTGGAPALRLVPAAGTDRAAAKRQAKLEAAQTAVDAADERLDAAAQALATQRREVRRREDELEQARAQLAEAQAAVRRAREQADKARASLDRARGAH